MVGDVAIAQHPASRWTSGAVNDLTSARHQICVGAGSLAELFSDSMNCGG